MDKKYFKEMLKLNLLVGIPMAILVFMFVGNVSGVHHNKGISAEIDNILLGNDIGGWYNPSKQFFAVRTDQSLEDIYFIAFHEIGHHYWDEYLSDEEKLVYCDNNSDVVLGYEPDEWCEENFANSYALSSLVIVRKY